MGERPRPQYDLLLLYLEYSQLTQDQQEEQPGHAELIWWISQDSSCCWLLKFGPADVIFNITAMRCEDQTIITFSLLSPLLPRSNHHFYISWYLVFQLDSHYQCQCIASLKGKNQQWSTRWCLILIFKIGTFDVNIKSLKFLWLPTQETFSPSLLCEKFLTNENYITLLCILTHCWDFRDWNKVNRLKTSLGKELRV